MVLRTARFSQGLTRGVGRCLGENRVVRGLYFLGRFRRQKGGWRPMDSSRSLMHLTAAFGACCGAWIGLGEPEFGLTWGMVTGTVFGAIVGKLMFPR